MRPYRLKDQRPKIASNHLIEAELRREVKHTILKFQIMFNKTCCEDAKGGQGLRTVRFIRHIDLQRCKIIGSVFFTIFAFTLTSN